MAPHPWPTVASMISGCGFIFPDAVATREGQERRHIASSSPMLRQRLQGQGAATHRVGCAATGTCVRGQTTHGRSCGREFFDFFSFFYFYPRSSIGIKLSIRRWLRLHVWWFPIIE
jgi:hypothetical protein